jgi:hypothetical protein
MDVRLFLYALNVVCYTSPLVAGSKVLKIKQNEVVKQGKEIQ